MLAGYVFTDFPRNTKEFGVQSLKTTSFLLIDKNYGPMLFDTGSAYDNEGLLNFLKKNFDLTAKDIKWVFNTHIHPDHVGGNRLFKNAKIVLSKMDYEFGKNIADAVFDGKDLLKYLYKHCPGYKTSFTQFEADNMKKIILDCWSEENIGINLNPLFIEDNPDIPPFIEIIPTFGHTFFHYSFIIRSGTHDILIAGDSLSMRMILREENEERFVEPHMDFNKYFESLKKIKDFKGLIVPGHDRPFYAKNLRAIRKYSFRLKDLPELIKDPKK